MKRNLTVGVAAAIVLSFVIALLLPPKPIDEAESVRRSHAIMRDVFRIKTTNVWYDVKATGSVNMPRLARLMGRNRVEYFLVQKSGPQAFDEIQGEFGSRQLGPDVGSFSYFTDWNPSEWRNYGPALDLAPWWVDALGDSCTSVELGTNISGTVWSARLFVYLRGSNTVVCAYIVEMK
jgi:hypothetical protein